MLDDTADLSTVDIVLRGLGYGGKRGERKIIIQRQDCKQRSGGEKAARQNADDIQQLTPSHWSNSRSVKMRAQTVKTAGGSRVEQDAGDGEAIMRPVDGCRAARH